MQKYPIRHEKVARQAGPLTDGRFALGFFLGVIVLILGNLFFDMLFEEPHEIEIFQNVPVIVSLLVSLVSVVLASRALAEQRMQREASTDPVLVAHLGQRADARELVTFNVTNVGAGAALNVTLDVDLPDGGVQDRDLVTDVFHRHHPFTVILQDRSIEFSLAMGWSLLGNSPLPPFKARLTYFDLLGAEYESEFLIDVREMEGMGANKSPQMLLVKSVDGVAKVLENIAKR